MAQSASDERKTKEARLNIKILETLNCENFFESSGSIRSVNFVRAKASTSSTNGNKVWFFPYQISRSKILDG